MTEKRARYRVALLLCVHACGPDERTEPAWAFDAFHVATPTAGSDYRVDKLEIFADGGAELAHVTCGGTDEASTGRWTLDGETLSIVPVGEGESLRFGDADYARMVLRRTDSCDAVELDGYSPGGAFQGTAELTRGDLCLNCGNVGEDQLQWCDGVAPPPCED